VRPVASSVVYVLMLDAMSASASAYWILSSFPQHRYADAGEAYLALGIDVRAAVEVEIHRHARQRVLLDEVDLDAVLERERFGRQQLERARCAGCRLLGAKILLGKRQLLRRGSLRRERGRHRWLHGFLGFGLGRRRWTVIAAAAGRKRLRLG
jgi:hypothetical protein